MKKAIIFDIGGVICPDIWESFIDKNGEYLELNSKSDILKIHQVASKLWGVYSTKFNLDWRALEKEYWSEFIEQTKSILTVDVLIEKANSQIVMYPGILDVLTKLVNQNWDLYAISNNTEFWYQRQKEMLNIDKFIPEEKTILSCRTGQVKNHENNKMFKRLDKVMSHEFKNTIYFDDRDYNLNTSFSKFLTGFLVPKNPELKLEFIKNKINSKSTDIVL